jgi:hypothetical protein
MAKTPQQNGIGECHNRTIIERVRSYMAGEEVFGSQKRKADVSLGFEGESHRPDKVNFSRPRIATRSSRANHTSCSLPNVVEELSPELHEDQAPYNLGTTIDVGRPGHVTAIHETTCKETELHIVRLPKTSAKACFAQQVITKKKCETKIVQGNKPTAAPTYTSVILHAHNARRSEPTSQKKIHDLESTDFQLPQRAVISPRRFFGMEELPFDLSSFPTPASPDEFPKTRSGKTIRKNNNAPTTK